MNKKEILQIADNYRKADRLRENGDKISEMKEQDSISPSYYIFKDLSQTSRDEIAMIFFKEANKYEEK